MIESYTGEDVFRQGVNVYLKDHAYGNATAEDFWNAIAKASHKPVNEVMPTFVNQAGAPLVNVETQCDGGTTSVTLEQQRYFYDRALFNSGTSELWQIPVCLKTPNAAGGSQAAPECRLPTQKRQTFKLKGCSPWVFANAGARGYYRLAYSPEAFCQIGHDAARSLAPEERISLAGNEWALVQVDKLKVGDYLALAESLKDDQTRAVFGSVMGRLSYIGDYLVNGSDRERFREWVCNLLGPMAQDLGWKPSANESDERRSLRSTAYGLLGYTGRDPMVLDEAKQLAEQYMENPASVDPSMVGTVISLAALDGDAKLYDQFQARVKTAKSPEEEYRYLYALTNFRDPVLLTRTLEYALSPEVRNQDSSGVLGSVMGNPEGRDIAWAFVKSHWNELQKKLTTWGGAGIVGSTGGFCDAKDRDDITQFFTQHKVQAAERALKKTIESVNYCIDLRSQQESNLASWLSHQAVPAGR